MVNIKWQSVAARDTLAHHPFNGGPDTGADIAQDQHLQCRRRTYPTCLRPAQATRIPTFGKEARHGDRCTWLHGNTVAQS